MSRSMMPLKSGESYDDYEIGGKARNLSKLIQAGLPVPDGWIVPAEEFNRHLIANDLAESAHAVFADPSDGNPFHIGMNPETGYKAMKEILTKQEWPTAVFCFSDYVAMGAMKAIEEKKYQIPKDIAVVGYDDIEFAPYLKVPLTTVKNPQYSIGAEAAKLLIRIIEDDISQPHAEGVVNASHAKVVLKPGLVIRESC